MADTMLTGGAGAGGGDPGSGGGGPPAGGAVTLDKWRDALPAEFRTEPSLEGIPDVPTLAKNYINTKKLVGADKLPKPSKTWKPEQWDEFFAALGRPKTDGDYEVPEVKFEDGMAVDDSMLKDAKKAFFQAGLTNDQAKKIFEFYFGTVAGRAKAEKVAKEEAQATATAALRQEWGTNFDAKLDMAKAVLRQFGGPELIEYLNQSGLGNDPKLIKAFAGIGAKVMEDKAVGTGHGALGVKASTAAAQEIDKLKGDQDFMKQLNDRYNPGHKVALARWEELFRTAYPNQ